MAKSVLITGGLGFMGHHLANHLLREEPSIRLTIVDNVSSTKIDYGHLLEHARIHVRDLRDYSADGQRFDHIYHLASPVGSLGILSRTGRIAEDIISLTYKAIDLTLRSGARLLFASSSEIYGRDGIHAEGARWRVNPAGGARSEYALGKMTSEVILRNLSLVHPIRYNACRPFNVIGEYQSAAIGFVVPTFFEAALRDRDLPVFAPGTQRRSFCHVGDAVRAMVAIQESDLEGETFNIGNDDNIVSILELAALIRELCGSESRIVIVDSLELFGKRYSEAFEKIPDIRKIHARLGWRPRLDLRQSLEKVRKAYLSEAAAGRLPRTFLNEPARPVIDARGAHEP